MGKKEMPRANKPDDTTLKSIPTDRRSAMAIRRGRFAVKVFAFVLPTIIGIAMSAVTVNAWWAAGFALIGLIIAFNTHAILEWETALVMRFGKLSRIVGSGLLFTIPFIEFVGAYVDQRLSATTFKTEKTLTADCMPVNVDAVLFWMIWDPKSACTEVKNYRDAVYWAAQTTLRDAIGNVNVAEISSRRKALDEEIKEALVAKTEQWGVTITSVEIRDIVIPEDLQDALSKEAQAERERNARITLAEAEEDISEIFVRASENYGNSPDAVNLRAMNMLYEGLKEKGGHVLIPTSLADVFGKVSSS